MAQGCQNLSNLKCGEKGYLDSKSSQKLINCLQNLYENYLKTQQAAQFLMFWGAL